jgi:hypothetical protein
MLSLVYCAVGVVGVVRIFDVSGFNSMIRCTLVCLPAFAAVSLGGVAFCRFLNQLVGPTPKFSTGPSLLSLLWSGHASSRTVLCALCSSK